MPLSPTGGAGQSGTTLEYFSTGMPDGCLCWADAAAGIVISKAATMKQSLRMSFSLLNPPIRRGNIGAGDVGELLRAAIAHNQLQFALQDRQHPFHSRLPEGAKPPQH